MFLSRFSSFSSLPQHRYFALPLVQQATFAVAKNSRKPHLCGLIDQTIQETYSVRPRKNPPLMATTLKSACKGDHCQHPDQDSVWGGHDYPTLNGHSLKDLLADPSLIVNIEGSTISEEEVRDKLPPCRAVNMRIFRPEAWLDRLFPTHYGQLS